MRKHFLRIAATVILFCILSVGLTACQEKETTYAEKSWKTAQERESLEAYIKESGSSLDMTALQQEAASEELSLSQQFKATALLCALEYQNQAGNNATDWKDGLFLAEYPISGSYADRFLAQIHTAGEEFWNAFEDAFRPYDCFWPIFAAATELDGETFEKLLAEVPEGSRIQTGWADAIERWVKGNPCKIIFVGDVLIDAGYFDDWSSTDFSRIYFDHSQNPYLIRTDTIDHAIAYVAYARDTLIPLLETRPNEFSYRQESTLTENMYYTTDVMVTLGETLSLNDAKTEGLPETIETEGKKVLAFYRNLQTEEFESSPPALQLMGDFMMGLSSNEFPSSINEADYLFILTPDYQYGGYYQSSSGSDTGIQQVFSNTSIDLYDAATGNLLRHLGTVTEEPPTTIFANYGETGLRYPEIVSADILTFIYRHINEPEAYVSLVDQTEGQSVFLPGQSVILGNWEITYHSADITETFSDNLRLEYTADAGNLYVQTFFTVTNRGLTQDTFLPYSNPYGEALEVYLLDAGGEEIYESENIIIYDNCLNATGIDPEESTDGELLFQIPAATAKNPEYLYIAITYGNQLVYYPLISENE